ncbi:unnamed protein product [Heterobilharzia americana]|nr:unnamed protein product [Heterobilharzia americana]
MFTSTAVTHYSYCTRCIFFLILFGKHRYIAQFFPSLLGWIPYSKGDSCDSTEASNCYGSFCVNNRTPPNLKDMFDTHDKKNGRRNNETGQSYRMVLNSLEESVIKVSPLPESYPTSDSSGNYQLPLENSVLQRSTDNISGSCTNIVQSNHSSELVPFNANELSIIPVTQQEDVAKVNLINATSTKLSSSTEMSISNDSVKSSPSSLPSSLLSHIGTPGGLIMNAELAKFIQEQASQVAARQQRFNMSTTTTTTTTTTMVNSNSQQLTSTGGGDGTTGNLVSEASIKSLSTGKTSLTTTLTRLSLSGAFKRDLPPRYAKLLQTELYEKEALENRRNQKQKELNSSLLLIDQPAPLARKESEAPTDLISLLSSSDVKAPIHHEQNVESLELNLSSKQMFHLPNSIDSSMHNPSPNYPSSIPQSLVPANIESSGIPFPSPDFFFRPPITASAAALANLSSSMSMKSYFPTDFQSSSLPPIHPIASSLNQTSFQSNWPTSTTDAYIPPQSHINHFYNPTVTSQHLPFLPMNNNHVNSSHHQFTNLNIPYHPLNLTGFTSPPPPPATCIIEQQVNFSNPIDNSDKSNNNNNS